MCIERKIIGKIHGEAFRHFSAILGWKHLEEDILEHFGVANPLTALVPDEKGISPDDAFSAVPYEKGYNLLYYIETLLTVTVFDKFLKDYITHFAGKCLTTDEWKDYLYSWVSTNVGAEGIKKMDLVDWDTWFYKPGMPPVTPKFDRSLAKACDDLAAKWEAARLCSEGELKAKISSTDMDSMLALQKSMSFSLILALDVFLYGAIY